MKNDIIYIGASDSSSFLFENQYPVPNGMAYNSYLIPDDKIAVIDTVDQRVSKIWQKKLDQQLNGKKPSYLVIQHLEPDHSANIEWFVNKYPETTLVCSIKAASMLQQFYPSVTSNIQGVKEGDTLNLGKHTLTFYMAPMVHWPEVMVCYESTTKSLFSADAFGEFGAVTDEGFDDDDWIPGARRYYYNICGKYGNPVQTLLKKASSLDIETIFPLHGPIHKDDVALCIEKYLKWSSYTPENESIFIAYASIHGNTESVVRHFSEMFKTKGLKVDLMDLSHTDVSYAVAEAFDHQISILASSSYDAGLFPPMENLLHHLQSKAFNNRTIGLIENGSWAPSAGRVMKEELGKMKNITILEPMVTIKSTLNDTSEKQLNELFYAICNSL
jgi:flavorubredoxin